MLASIIVPVYQESTDSLLRFSGWLSSQTDRRVEIIIVATFEELDRLRKLLPERSIIAAPRGRAKQMNAGAATARGRYLLFLHCDTMLEKGWIETLDQSPQVEWGAFTPAIEGTNLIYRLAEKWGLWRSRVLGLPYGDQCIFVSRVGFESCGGYDTAHSIMEDVELSRRLRRLHHMPNILDLKAWTSDRAWKNRGVYLYSMRNLILLSLFLLGMNRRLLERIAKVLTP